MKKDFLLLILWLLFKYPITIYLSTSYPAKCLAIIFEDTVRRKEKV